MTDRRAEPRRPGAPPERGIPAARRALAPALVSLALATPTGCGDGGSATSLGGAQDIGQFRAILDAGGIPGEQTLDADGFFNEHFVEPPAADCGQTLCAHALFASHRDWTTGAPQDVLELVFSSPLDPDTMVRPPLDLVVVVDTSASMADDDKLVLVKHGIDLAVDALEPGDRFGLVAYSKQAEPIVALSPVDDPGAVHDAIAALAPHGSTNLHAGLQQGLSALADGSEAGRQRRAILVSDGVPSSGVVDPTTIMSMVQSYVAQGIALTTIGVGADADQALLAELASRSSSTSYFIDDAGAVDEIFAEELATVVVPIATELAVEVVPTTDYALGEVLGAPRADGGAGGKRPDGSLSIQAPAVFLASRAANRDPGGRRGGGSAIFVAVTPTAGANAERPVATIHATFRDAATGELVAQDATLEAPLPGGRVPAEPWFSHEAMAKSWAMYNVFLGLRAAAREAPCNHDCAYGTLAELHASASRWLAVRFDEDIDADRELIDRFQQNLVAAGVDPAHASDAQCGCFGDDVCSVATPGAPPARRTAPGLAALGLVALALAATRRRGRA